MQVTNTSSSKSVIDYPRNNETEPEHLFRFSSGLPAAADPCLRKLLALLLDIRTLERRVDLVAR
ncbi:unnamed protein product [Ceratitis capitata]|uniref:(Mediterranean fruit fly) hypothetical protein n=1 Tax=Ceratitis capitata TaxID=7213 RepID=A0A811U9D6_CERCA|nr:unnamed protein product [Ceratitis capitata]